MGRLPDEGRGIRGEVSYHSLLRELLDLLHGPRGPLLEADTVQLDPPKNVSPTCPLLSHLTVPFLQSQRSLFRGGRVLTSNSSQRLVQQTEHHPHPFVPPRSSFLSLVLGSQTYSLVHVDGVLAGDDVGDGGAAGLAGGLGFRRHCGMIATRQGGGLEDRAMDDKRKIASIC